MKSILITCSLLFLFSCKEKNSETTTTTSDSASADSIPHQISTSSEDFFYKEIARLDLPKYSIVVKTKYDSPDHNAGNYAFVYDKIRNKTDSLELTVYHDLYDLKIEDLTDSLKFKKLGVLLCWSGDSDILTHEFVGYDGDSLKTLFEATGIVSLRRKDQWTLAGFVSRRDEIVGWSQDDYPMTVSLKTGEVEVMEPPVHYIGVESRALEDVHVHLMKTPKDSSAYTMKAGTNFVVDTLYRSRNYVKLITKDSLILHAVPDSLTLKILVNTAG